MARCKEAFAKLDTDVELAEKLRESPHPMIKGKTMLDYVNFLRRHAGLTGKLNAVATINRFINFG